MTPCYKLDCNIVQSSFRNMKPGWMRLFSMIYRLIYIACMYVQKIERYDGERWRQNNNGQNFSVQTVNRYSK